MNAKVTLLNIITFTAAFLLFQIELIVAKVLLPHYGGSYLVWGSCIVFFQAVLLSGYVFAHWAVGRWGIARYRWAHLGLFFVPLLFFPGKTLVLHHWRTPLPLTVNVFVELLMTIGPVFFILSTVSLVTQSFLSRTDFPMKDNPYYLYAVSNLGSFAALLSYPFVFEYFLTIPEQLMIWRVLYGGLIAAHGILFGLARVRRETVRPAADTFDIEPAVMGRWMLLGAAGTVMFLSVNNIITTEITPVPLLWILPLSIYLITYVFNFKQQCWCPAWIREKIAVSLGLSMLLFFLFQQPRTFPFLIKIILLSGALFVLCMYCQNRLIRTRPADDRHLTAFYVIIALGSFLGGIMTSWVVPLFSTSFVEFLIGLILVAFTLPPPKTDNRIDDLRLILFFSAFMVLWPMVITQYTLWHFVFIGLIVKFVYGQLGRDRLAVVVSLVVIVVMLPILEEAWLRRPTVYKKRNYYGTYWVYDRGGIRAFYHGFTLHGAQVQATELENEPVMYYSRTSPLGDIMGKEGFDFRRVGIIGLGAGTMAAYARPGQIFDFYELDPDVHSIASRYFTYLNNSRGTVRSIIGDARVSLELNQEASYDLIVVDAFGGDSIPVHLITAEMVELYKKRLDDHGILLFHISNRFIDLWPILARTGTMMGAYVGQKSNDEAAYLEMPSAWVVLTWNREYYNALVSQSGWKYPDTSLYKHVRLWTDDYSSILPIIQGETLVESLRNFNLLKGQHIK